MMALSALAIGGGVFLFAICALLFAFFVSAEARRPLDNATRLTGGRVVMTGVLSLVWIASWLIARWLA